MYRAFLELYNAAIILMVRWSFRRDGFHFNQILPIEFAISLKVFIKVEHESEDEEPHQMIKSSDDDPRFCSDSDEIF
jgi:hypothetical protein